MLVNLVKNPNIIANPPPISKRITKGKKEGSIPILNSPLKNAKKPCSGSTQIKVLGLFQHIWRCKKVSS